MNSYSNLSRLSLSVFTLFFLFHFSLPAQTPIYNFQQVDSLPTFQSCPTVSKSDVEPWIECFFPQIEKRVIDSIESMSQQVGMSFEGTIKVNFVIDETGKVVEMELKNKPHPILKKAAKDVLISLSDLKPAKLKGQAVAVNITLEIEHYPDGKNEVVVDKEAVYKEVTVMPRFPGCEGLYPTLEEISDCSRKKMRQFLSRRFKYPAAARENGIEGTVVIGMIVEIDGSISNIIITRDIGGGCAEQVAQAFEKMNEEGIKWIPGELDGNLVRTQVYYPTKFWLE